VVGRDSVHTCQAAGCLTETHRQEKHELTGYISKAAGAGKGPHSAFPSLADIDLATSYSLDRSKPMSASGVRILKPAYMRHTRGWRRRRWWLWRRWSVGACRPLPVQSQETKRVGVRPDRPATMLEGVNHVVRTNQGARHACTIRACGGGAAAGGRAPTIWWSQTVRRGVACWISQANCQRVACPERRWRLPLKPPGAY